MEKRKPHYSLVEIKQCVAQLGSQAFTATAKNGGRAMGMGITLMLAVIDGLSGRCFYKSMTATRDPKIWQDVYHADTPNGTAYIKFAQRADGAIVISFKRL